MKMKKVNTWMPLFFTPVAGFVYMFVVLFIIWYKDMRADYEIAHYGGFGENELTNLILFIVIQVISMSTLFFLTK